MKLQFMALKLFISDNDNLSDYLCYRYMLLNEVKCRFCKLKVTLAVGQLKVFIKFDMVFILDLRDRNHFYSVTPTLHFSPLINAASLGPTY